MKRAIGWCIAWALYWLGDVASKLISGARSPWSKA